MTSLQPLSWTYVPPKRRFWNCLFFYDSKGENKARNEVTHQLGLREQPDSTIWGDIIHQKVAKLICADVKKYYKWPNDFFIPEDPFKIVFLIPWDDYDYFEIMWRVIAKLKSKYEKEADLYSIQPETLGELVNTIVSTMKQLDKNFGDNL